MLSDTHSVGIEKVVMDNEKYFMENNAKEAAEVERLTHQHEVIKDHMGSLILAPVDLSKPGLKILDSATADGLWLRDLRSDTPVEHTYIGTDITESYFPLPSTLPNNVLLYVQSITKPWPSDWNSSFDFVHQRFALPAAGRDGIPDALKGLIGLLKPGAWIQLIDADHSVFTGPAMGDLWKVMKEIFKIMNLQDDVAPNVRRYFEAAGLEEVHEKIMDVQLGALNPNPSLAAKGVASFTLGAKAAIGAAKMMNTPFSPEFLETLGERIEAELRTEGGINRAHVVWGRRAM